MITTPLSPEFVAGLTAGEGCFDLQFHRDVRRERKGNPIYYSWKVQFVISLKNKDLELIKRLPEVFGCGTVHTPIDYARFSVQDIDNLYHIVLPFFQKYPPYGNKQKDFELWAEAIEILYANKFVRKPARGKQGFVKKTWKRTSFQRILELHTLMQPYKSIRPQGYKWIKEAERFAETLED
jgi:hypothetical protein